MTAAFALDGGDDIAVARELISMKVTLADDILADPGADLFAAIEELA